MTILVQQPLLDTAANTEDRAEAMIAAHRLAARFIRLALERAAADIAKVAPSPLEMPDDLTPHELVVLLRRIMPPDYPRNPAAEIALSARAHFVAMQEATNADAG